MAESRPADLKIIRETLLPAMHKAIEFPLRQGQDR